MEDIRYPIGKFITQENYTSKEITANIERIDALPAKLEAEIQHLDDQQLDTPYREAGWTVRQVVHHLADSHLHAYVRTKWTLTENQPVIKAYLEKLWAETSETKSPPAMSIAFLHALHAKWSILLKSTELSDLDRIFIHPESKKQITLKTLIATYAWHGEHHLAHIAHLKKRKGW